jgi:hypothetical protein
MSYNSQLLKRTIIALCVLAAVAVVLVILLSGDDVDVIRSLRDFVHTG